MILNIKQSGIHARISSVGENRRRLLVDYPAERSYHDTILNLVFRLIGAGPTGTATPPSGEESRQ